jgi:hypothetical protein
MMTGHADAWLKPCLPYVGASGRTMFFRPLYLRAHHCTSRNARLFLVQCSVIRSQMARCFCTSTLTAFACKEGGATMSCLTLFRQTSHSSALTGAQTSETFTLSRFCSGGTADVDVRFSYHASDWDDLTALSNPLSCYRRCEKAVESGKGNPTTLRWQNHSRCRARH